MTARRIFLRKSAAALVLALAACTSAPPPDTGDYVARLSAARAAKDEFFLRGSDSPVPPAQRADVIPLAYFPIDPAYDVPAALRPAADGMRLQMPTSTGQMRDMRRVGTLGFTLKGRALTLAAFVEVGAADMDHLFVPFTDLTSGTETYPGGRYLDLDRNDTNMYEIDFNRAYHPYCYFNPTFDCPLPPAENRLSIPVRAGERLKIPSK